MTTQISNSEIQTWLRCPRKWLTSYYWGFAPAEEPVTGNRELGTRVHAALQYWRDPAWALDPVATLDALYAIQMKAHPEYRAELAKEHELAVIMVSGYLEWLESEGRLAGLDFVAAEQEVTVPLPGLPGVELRAKLDAVLADESDGMLTWLDYKTSDSFDQHELLALDPQFKTYSLIAALRAAAGDGPPVMGGMVHTLRRVKRTSRSQPPYYAEDRFRYNPEQLEATLAKVQGVCSKIMAAREMLAEVGGDLERLNYVQRHDLPPNEMPRDCSWSCPFVTLCPMMSDGSDWAGALTGSGRWVQGDPYAHYSRDPIEQIRAELAALSPAPDTLSSAEEMTTT